MSKFLTTTHRSVNWFKRTHDSNELEMKPPFQRNPVWSLPQKRYLIDSILNGFPIPEIYMQEFVDDRGSEQHVVIDGQQRIRACLEFLEGSFELIENETDRWEGMAFEDLSSEDKKRVLGYTFIVRLLPEMSDADIRGIFQRLNKNVVALNAQELRQATYWGPFIRTIQEISNYTYWSTTGIFTPLNYRRMMDVEFISELAVAILQGHQNKKETLDRFYQDYETEFDSRDELIQVFQRVIFELEQLFPDIKNQRWRKKTDFYSLFIFLATKSEKLPLEPSTRVELRKRLIDFGDEVTVFLSVSEEKQASFSDDVVDYGKSVRASSDVGNRKRRHAALESVVGDLFTDSSNAVAPVEIAPYTEDLFNEGNLMVDDGTMDG